MYILVSYADNVAVSAGVLVEAVVTEWPVVRRNHTTGNATARYSASMAPD